MLAFEIVNVSLKVPSNMISFTDTADKSIHHIRGTSKQKATAEGVLNYFWKKDQFRDLPAADLEEKFNTLCRRIVI